MGQARLPVRYPGVKFFSTDVSVDDRTTVSTLPSAAYKMILPSMGGGVVRSVCRCYRDAVHECRQLYLHVPPPPTPYSPLTTAQILTASSNAELDPNCPCWTSPGRKPPQTPWCGAEGSGGGRGGEAAGEIPPPPLWAKGWITPPSLHVCRGGGKQKPSSADVGCGLGGLAQGMARAAAVDPAARTLGRSASGSPSRSSPGDRQPEPVCPEAARSGHPGGPVARAAQRAAAAGARCPPKGGGKGETGPHLRPARRLPAPGGRGSGGPRRSAAGGESW